MPHKRLGMNLLKVLFLIFLSNYFFIFEKITFDDTYDTMGVPRFSFTLKTRPWGGHFFRPRALNNFFGPFGQHF